MQADERISWNLFSQRNLVTLQTLQDIVLPLTQQCAVCGHFPEGTGRHVQVLLPLNTENLEMTKTSKDRRPVKEISVQ